MTPQELIQKYEETLYYYATKSNYNWKGQLESADSICQPRHMPPYFDYGYTAMKALGVRYHEMTREKYLHKDQ